VFTDEEKRAIIDHFEQAWPEVLESLTSGGMFAAKRDFFQAAATDVMRDYAVDRAGIRRELSDEEDHWLVEQAKDRL
jgi:hypothetical protein